MANQGAFESALKYVTGSENEKVAELSQRLYYSLRMIQQPDQQQHQQQPQQNNMYQNKFNQGRSSIPQIQPSFVPPVPQQINYNSGFSQPEMPRTSQFTPMTPMLNPSQPQPSVLPPMEPPARPSSVGSASGGTGLMAGRSKYVLDPSVQSGPNYGQAATNYFNPVAPMQQAPAPMAPTQMFTPQQQFNSSTMSNPMGFVDPGSNQMGQQMMQPTQNSQGSFAPPPAMGRNPTPPPGWNDPPVPTSMRQKTKPVSFKK